MGGSLPGEHGFPKDEYQGVSHGHADFEKGLKDKEVGRKAPKFISLSSNLPQTVTIWLM